MKYEEVAELWNKGFSEEEIGTKLHIRPLTVMYNLREARLRGIELIGFDDRNVRKTYDPNLEKDVYVRRKKTESKKSKYPIEKEELLENYKATFKKNTEQFIKESIEEILESDSEIQVKIKALMKFAFPLEIARLLDIKPKEVFEVVDGLTETEKDEIKRQFVTNRLNISDNINALVELGLNYGKALLTLNRHLPKELTIEMADVYFCIGEENKALRILQDLYIIYSTPKEIQEKARKRRDELKMEFKARKIKDYVRKRQGNVSYDEICKKYKVRENFIVDLLGREEKDY